MPLPPLPSLNNLPQKQKVDQTQTDAYSLAHRERQLETEQSKGRQSDKTDNQTRDTDKGTQTDRQTKTQPDKTDNQLETYRRVTTQSDQDRQDKQKNRQSDENTQSYKDRLRQTVQSQRGTQTDKQAHTQAVTITQHLLSNISKEFLGQVLVTSVLITYRGQA